MLTGSATVGHAFISLNPDSPLVLLIFIYITIGCIFAVGPEGNLWEDARGLCGAPGLAWLGVCWFSPLVDAAWVLGFLRAGGLRGACRGTGSS